MRKIEQISIGAADRERLERLVRDRNTPQKVVWRARIVLSAADGLTARDAFIWDGYMTGGAALIDEAERRPQDRDGLVYPILFNYRHGLETALKWIIERYGRLASVRLDPNDRSHDL